MVFDYISEFSCKQYWNGRKVIATAVSLESHVGTLLDDNPDGPYIFQTEIFEYLQDSYNFNGTKINGTGFISQNENGELTGMGAEIINKVADICLSSSEFLEYRGKQLTFLHPTHSIKALAFFKQPDVTSIRNIHIEAFSPFVWLLFATCSILLLVASAISLLIILKKGNETISQEKQVSNLLFSMLTALLLQGNNFNLSNSTTLRIIIITSLAMSFVLFTAYSGVLVAFQSFRLEPIATFQDLFDMNFDIYYDKYTFYTEILVDKLQDDYIIPKKPRGIFATDALSYILKEGNVYLGIADGFFPVLRQILNEKELNRLSCDVISQLEVSRRPILAGMTVAKDAKILKECFNRRIIIMYERGMRNRYGRVFIRDSTVQCTNTESHVKLSKSIECRMYDVLVVFILFGIGCIIALGLLCCERLQTTIFNENKYI